MSTFLFNLLLKSFSATFPLRVVIRIIRPDTQAIRWILADIKTFWRTWSNSCIQLDNMPMGFQKDLKDVLALLCVTKYFISIVKRIYKGYQSSNPFNEKNECSCLVPHVVCKCLTWILFYHLITKIIF